MPELPDVTVYVEALRERIVGHWYLRAVIRGPFLLRSVHTAARPAEGKSVREVRRVGKRIAIGLEDDLWLVLHLMIAGRLHWKPGTAKLGAKSLAAFEFDNGTLSLTEAGSQHRASLNMVGGRAWVWRRSMPAESKCWMPTSTPSPRFSTSANHTLKRALTDPRLFSGIGNAYSDEILHRARNCRRWL